MISRVLERFRLTTKSAKNPQREGERVDLQVWWTGFGGCSHGSCQAQAHESLELVRVGFPPSRGGFWTVEEVPPCQGLVQIPLLWTLVSARTGRPVGQQPNEAKREPKFRSNFGYFTPLANPIGPGPVPSDESGHDPHPLPHRQRCLHHSRANHN